MDWTVKSVVKFPFSNYSCLVFRVTDDASSPLKQVFEEYSATLGIDVAQLKVDIVMANPPFFEDVADSIGADSTRSLSRAPPKSTSSAARQESQIVGGEVGFAKRLAEDSLIYKANVGYVTVFLVILLTL